MKNLSNEASKSPAKKSARTSAIASLNDKTRKELNSDNTYLCLSIIQKGESFFKQALSQISDTSTALTDDDTDEERSCGSTVVDETKLSWSIDYFDLEEESESSDAANPEVTVRTLTVWVS